jgi:hypothetical protein
MSDRMAEQQQTLWAFQGGPTPTPCFRVRRTAHWAPVLRSAVIRSRTRRISSSSSSAVAR